MGSTQAQKQISTYNRYKNAFKEIETDICIDIEGKVDKDEVAFFDCDYKSDNPWDFSTGEDIVNVDHLHTVLQTIIEIIEDVYTKYELIPFFLPFENKLKIPINFLDNSQQNKIKELQSLYDANDIVINNLFHERNALEKDKLDYKGLASLLNNFGRVLRGINKIFSEKGQNKKDKINPNPMERTTNLNNKKDKIKRTTNFKNIFKNFFKLKYIKAYLIITIIGMLIVGLFFPKPFECDKEEKRLNLNGVSSVVYYRIKSNFLDDNK